MCLNRIKQITDDKGWLHLRRPGEYPDGDRQHSKRQPHPLPWVLLRYRVLFYDYIYVPSVKEAIITSVAIGAGIVTGGMIYGLGAGALVLAVA